MKNIILIFLALPFFLIACKEDDPSPECRDVVPDTSNIKLNVYELYGYEGYYLDEYIQFIDTALGNNASTTSDTQILKPSFPFEKLVVYTVWGDTLKGDVQNGFVCKPRIKEDLFYANFEFEGKGYYRLKRCNKPDTLIYKVIRGEKKVYKSDFQSLFPKSYRNVLYSRRSDKTDSIVIQLSYQGRFDTINDFPSYFPYEMRLSGSVPRLNIINSNIVYANGNKFSYSGNFRTDFVTMHGIWTYENKLKLYYTYSAQSNSTNPLQILVFE